MWPVCLVLAPARPGPFQRGPPPPAAMSFGEIYKSRARLSELPCVSTHTHTHTRCLLQGLTDLGGVEGRRQTLILTLSFHQSSEAWLAARASFSSSRGRGASGRARSPQSWRWPCAMQARRYMVPRAPPRGDLHAATHTPLLLLSRHRWDSWTWICVAPASPACCKCRARPCTSAMGAGCPCTSTLSSGSRLCPWVSCWSTPTRQWCGAARRRMVQGATGWYTGVGEPPDRASLDHRECPAHRPVCVLCVGSLRDQPDPLTLRKGIPALC